MIALVNGGTLTIKLSGAATSVNPYFMGSYVDTTIAGGITVDGAIAPAQTNGVTPVTIVAAPAAGTTRHLTGFSLTNTDTGAVTVTILFGGQALVTYGLSVGDVLQYGKNADVFTVLSTTGSQKQVVATTSTTTPSTQTFGDTAVVGTDATPSHADHKHLWPTVAQAQLALLTQPKGVTSTAMGGTTTTLTNASTRLQLFTGSGATAQTVVLPDATTIPFVDWVYEFDNDTSGTGILTVQANGGATLWTIGPGAGATISLVTKSVAAGTWNIDATSTNIPTGKSQAAGMFVKQTVYLTGSSATHTYQAGISAAIIEGIAGGGGGGGASFSTPNMGFGAGGAAGGYFSVRVTAGLSTATYTVGIAGTAGANTGGIGGTGGDTIVIHNSVTYTAKGGLGGVGQTAAVTLDSALGGAGVAGTNGDILSPGACGQNSVRFSGILGSSGAGGASVYGGGGAGVKTNSAGLVGTGYGSGGGGAAAVSASQVGGAGVRGIVIITEYS